MEQLAPHWKTWYGVLTFDTKINSRWFNLFWKSRKKNFLNNFWKQASKKGPINSMQQGQKHPLEKQIQPSPGTFSWPTSLSSTSHAFFLPLKSGFWKDLHWLFLHHSSLLEALHPALTAARTLLLALPAAAGPKATVHLWYGQTVSFLWNVFPLIFVFLKF